MVRVAVIGEPARIRDYGLAGAILCPAIDQAEAVVAWRNLPEEIEVAVLTPSAARWLASEIARRPWVLPVLLAELPQGRTMAGQVTLADLMAEPGPLGDPGALAGPSALAGPGAGTEPHVPPVPPVPPIHGCEPQT